MSSVKSCLFTFLLLFTFISLSSNKINAQEIFRGLGYVDTKTIYNSDSIYYPYGGMTFDSNRNMYISGNMHDQGNNFTSIDFDWNSGGASYTGNFYLGKYSPTGVFLWGLTYGNQTNYMDPDAGIVVDADDNLYIAGSYTGTIDFDFTGGEDIRTSNARDAYIMRINADGSYGWTVTWGAAQYDYVRDIAIDPDRGAIYALGYVYATSVDLNPGGGSDVQTNSGLTISKFDLNGNYQWGYAYGNAGGFSDQILRVKPSTGDVYFSSGIRYTIDFDPGAGVDSITGTGDASNGTVITGLTSSKGYLGTTKTSVGILSDFIFDSSENIFLTGKFTSTRDFDPRATTDSVTSAGGSDVYLTKWDATNDLHLINNLYAWTKRFGGSSGEGAYKLGIDSFDNVYVTGVFYNSNVDFDFSSGTDLHSAVNSNAWLFLSIVDNVGNYIKTYSWGSSDTNGNGWVDVSSIHIDSQGRVYVYGSFMEDTDFDPTEERYIKKGTHLVNWDYNYDIFVSMFYPYIATDPGDLVGTFGIEGETYSSVSSLSGLTTSEGALTPTFSPSIYSYVRNVDELVNTINLTATTTSSTSRVAINGYAVESGIASNNIALKSGPNPIDTTVWAEDLSSVATYSVNVNKPLIPGNYYDYDSILQIANVGTNVSAYKSLIDGDDNHYITGFFGAGPVDFGVPAYGDDIVQGRYLLKLDANMDPLWVLKWESGTNYADIYNIALDTTGAIYVTGGYKGTIDLDPTSNEDIRTASGTLDAFLIKVNANGTIGFIHTWGGTSLETATDVVTDSNNNVYVGGYFYSTTDFDPTSGEFIVNRVSQQHWGYLSKFSPDGSYSWTKVFRATNTVDTWKGIWVYFIEVDSYDNVYVAGDFKGDNVDFDPSENDDLFSTLDENGLYLTKINSDGSYGWTRVTLGYDVTMANNYGGGMAINSSDDIYITGFFSTDAYWGDYAYLNPDTPLVPYASIDDTTDIFIQKFSSDSSCYWAKTFGGYWYDQPSAITINSDDSLFIGGWFDDVFDFDPTEGEDIHTSPTDGSGFVIQMNGDDQYVWGYPFFTDNWTEVTSINFASNGDMYLSGDLQGTTDFNPTSETNNTTAMGSQDAFLVRFTPSVYDNANLSSLLISDGTLEPTFNPSITSYDVSVDGTVTEIAFTPTTESQNALGIDINSTFVSSGETSPSFDLNAGSNIFTLTVIAGDGTTTKEYNIDVTRAEGGSGPSITNAWIENLTISLGAKDSDTSLNVTTPIPVFDNVNRTIGVYQSNILLALVNVELSTTRNWINVSGAVDINEKKAFVHNLAQAPGTASTYTMYLPKGTSDDRIRVCPNATALSQIGPLCSGVYELSIQSPNVNTTTIGEQSYWTISGLTTTGAQSFKYESTGSPTPVTEAPTIQTPQTEEPLEDDITLDEEEELPENFEEEEETFIPVSGPVDLTGDEQPSQSFTNSLKEVLSTFTEDPTRTAYALISLITVFFLINVLIGSTSPLAYILQFISFILAAFKIKEKGRDYGIVYDSVTKEPINRAIIRIFDLEGNLVSTEVTDIFGVFDTTLKEGKYRIEIQLRTHLYPSRVILGENDLPYENIYKGENFSYNSDTPLNYSVPVDPIDKNFAEYATVAIRSLLTSIFTSLQFLLVLIGFVVVLIGYLDTNETIHLIFIFLYLILFLIHLYNWYKNRKKYGYAYDIDENKIKGVELGLKETEFGRLSAKRVTDEKGRYRFLVPGGKYKLESLNPSISLLNQENLLHEGDSGRIMTIKPDVTLRKSYNKVT